jgi:hypothetical protein
MYQIPGNLIERFKNKTSFPDSLMRDRKIVTADHPMVIKEYIDVDMPGLISPVDSFSSHSFFYVQNFMQKRMGKEMRTYPDDLVQEILIIVESPWFRFIYGRLGFNNSELA